jgi:acetylglutamate kinase
MVYAGLINKQICAQLQGKNCNAIGLSGADANTIQASLRDTAPIDYGWVGDISKVNSSPIQLFLTNNITPVFCAINHDGKGQLLNTNADTVAAEIAIEMSKEYDTELIYCFEENGVLEDIKDPTSVITSISQKTYTDLKAKGIIAKGMIPKLDNCFHALKHNVAKVIIGNASLLGNENELYTTLMK